MPFNISTSPENQALVKRLTQRMDLGTENHIALMALTYSLCQGHRLDLSQDLKPAGGKAYKAHILFGDYKAYYIALICQRYQIHKSDANVKKYLKLHIDDGLLRIHRFFEENKGASGADFLLESIGSGIYSTHEIQPLLEVDPNKMPPSKGKPCVEPLKHRGGEV